MTEEMKGNKKDDSTGEEPRWLNCKNCEVSFRGKEEKMCPFCLEFGEADAEKLVKIRKFASSHSFRGVYFFDLD